MSITLRNLTTRCILSDCEMRFMVTVGLIKFDEYGVNDDPSIVKIVRGKGSMVQYKKDGDWIYEYYLYSGRIIGLQWHKRTYVSAWLLDKADESLARLNKEKKDEWHPFGL